jgi:hypothetical protein
MDLGKTRSSSTKARRTRRERALPPDVVAHAMGWLEAQDVASAASVSKVFASGCASERLWQEQYVRTFGGGGATGGGGGSRGEGKGRGSVAPAPLSRTLLPPLPPCAQSKAVRGEKGADAAHTRTWWRRFKRRFRIERNWLSPGQRVDIYPFSSLALNGHTGVVWVVHVWWERGLVFSGSSDMTIRMWSLHNGECKAVLFGHTDTVTCLAGAPQTGTLVSGSWDCTVRVWSTASGQCVHVLRGHTYAVYCVALLPGHIIVSAGSDGQIKVWDGGEGKLVRSMPAGNVSIYAVVSDGKRIVTGSAVGNIRIFDMETGACTELLFQASRCISCLILRGNVLVAGCGDGKVRSWDLSVGKARMREFQGGSSNSIESLCFQEGVGPLRAVTMCANGEVELWDVASARCLSVWQCDAPRFIGQQIAADLHRLVYTAGKEVKVLDFSDE